LVTTLVVVDLANGWRGGLGGWGDNQGIVDLELAIDSELTDLAKVKLVKGTNPLKGDGTDTEVSAGEGVVLGGR
jgi:hypothetical protein